MCTIVFTKHHIVFSNNEVKLYRINIHNDGQEWMFFVYYLLFYAYIFQCYSVSATFRWSCANSVVINNNVYESTYY